MLRLLLILLLLATPAHAGMVIGSGAVCTAYHSQETDDAYLAIGRYTGYYYLGIMWIPANGTSGQLCKFTAEVSLGGGTIVGKTFYAQLWTVAGDGTLGTQQGSDSAGVTGSDAWNSTDVDFTFSAPYPTWTGNGTQKYAICITMKEIDETNYATWRYITTGADAAYSRDRWAADKTNTGEVTNEYHFHTWTIQ